MGNDDIADVSRRTLFNRQLLAALSPLMGAFVASFSNNISRYPVPTYNFFILVSFPFGAALLGNLLSGIGMELLGRKRITMLGFNVSALGWMFMGFQYTAIGNLICRLGTGLLAPLVPVYIGEVSEPAYRVVFLTLIVEASILGSTLVTLVEMLAVEKVRDFVCGIVISITCLIICIKCRESPIWLMNKGKTKKAMDQWVHIRGLKSLHEFRAMERTPLKGTVFSKEFLWPLAVSCSLFFVYRFCTLEIIIYWAKSFLMLLEGPLLAFVIEVLVAVVAGIVLCLLMAKCKRRTLTIISGLGSVCSALVMYACISLHSAEIVFFIFSLSCFVFLMVLQPLPLIMCGELFPRNLRGIGASLACGFSTICLCIKEIVELPMIAHGEPQHELFAVYGVSMILALIFLCWKLPETKDKTLLEIEHAFDKNSEETDAATIEMVEQRHAV